MNALKLLQAWVRDIDSVPIPVLVDTETAVTVIQEAQQR